MLCSRPRVTFLPPGSPGLLCATLLHPSSGETLCASPGGAGEFLFEFLAAPAGAGPSSLILTLTDPEAQVAGDGSWLRGGAGGRGEGRSPVLAAAAVPGLVFTAPGRAACELENGQLLLPDLSYSAPAGEQASSLSTTSLSITSPRTGDAVHSPLVPLRLALSSPERGAELSGTRVCVSAAHLPPSGAVQEASGCLLLPGDVLEYELPAELAGVPGSIDVRVLVSFPDSGPLAGTPLLLVLSHYDEDLSWLSHSPFPSLIYSKQPPSSPAPPSHHRVAKNVAGEAAAYLSFIVDYYDSLPDAALFLHSHRYSYHSEDLLVLLWRLHGRVGGEERFSFSDSYCNINGAVWGTREDPGRSYLKENWDAWLGRHLGGYEPPFPVLLDRCCAQFVAGRERIRSRPLSFYEEALAVVNEAEEGSEESRKKGLLMEWVWHVVFGESWVAEDVAELLPRVGDFDQATLEERAWCVQ